MTRLVVDACVGAKWYFDEPYAQQSRLLLLGPWELLAPDYFQVELANICWKKVLQKELTEQTAAVVVGAPSTSDVTFYRDAPRLLVALELGIRFELAVYDALYLALALEEDCQVVTADAEFYKAAGRTFPETMLWVADIPGV